MTVDTADLPLLALAGLGALHGINPGMGWLFAVSLGLQRQDRRAVWASLGPLALGHALSVGVALVVLAAVGQALPQAQLRPFIAVLLIGVGGYRLVRHRHARYGGMQVTARQLTVWSFLMASGHGAGLMVLPLVTAGRDDGTTGSHAHHVLTASIASAGDSSAILATLLHTAGYLLVTGLVAVLVYEKLGLRLLRKAWINIDFFWSFALMITGAIVAVQ